MINLVYTDVDVDYIHNDTEDYDFRWEAAEVGCMGALETPKEATSCDQCNIDCPVPENLCSFSGVGVGKMLKDGEVVANLDVTVHRVGDYASYEFNNTDAPSDKLYARILMHPNVDMTFLHTKLVNEGCWILTVSTSPVLSLRDLREVLAFSPVQLMILKLILL